MITLNPKLKRLLLPALGGLLIAGFRLYGKSGKIGLSEIMVLLITALVILGVFFVINKMTTKNNE